jgi:regulator of nonsense transcripts 2
VPAEGPAPELEEEKIVVTRLEEQRDPELDAEFDRELAKLTAESLDSRKFDRKPMFDVPLPIKRNDQRAGGAPDDGATTAVLGSSDTMAFSLLTKRGNRQQVRSPLGLIVIRS